MGLKLGRSHLGRNVGLGFLRIGLCNLEVRKLHNEKLNDLYCSTNIVRVIKSRRMRWAGHVARIGLRRGVYRVLVG